MTARLQPRADAAEGCAEKFWSRPEELRWDPEVAARQAMMDPAGFVESLGSRAAAGAG